MRSKLHLLFGIGMIALGCFLLIPRSTQKITCSQKGCTKSQPTAHPDREKGSSSILDGSFQHLIVSARK